MVQLAIKGHATRGKEIIEILEMLGGKNVCNLTGDETMAYYIIENKEIKGGIYIFGNEPYFLLTLEEFLEKYPFKVGDKVLISEYESEVRICKMRWCSVCNYVEYMVYRNDEVEWYTAEELLEYNAEMLDNIKIDSLNKEENMEEKIIDTIKESEDMYRLQINHQYEIEVDGGEYYVVRRNPNYPKTYEECVKELGYKQVLPINNILGYKGTLLSSFQQLLICRDAYWKVYGKEIGLNESWKPKNPTFTYFHTIENKGGFITKNNVSFDWVNRILVFPTVEMRDAFYNNFKDLIYECEELL